ELYAEPLEGVEVAARLDALREEPGMDAPPERDERLHECLLGVVARDPPDDLLVDLDDRRVERGDEREAGIARAGIVDGEPEPQAAQRLDLALERDDVLDRLLLGALERHLARRQAGGPDRLRELLGGELRIEQRRGREVDGDLEARVAGRPRALEAPRLEEDALDQEQVQLDRTAG